MILDEVATYLDTQLVTLTAGTNLFAGTLPETPIECVALFENLSMPPVETHGDGTRPVIEKPRLQVIVRSTNYSSGRVLIDSVWEQLQVVSNDTLSGVRYFRIASSDSPTLLNRDANQRPLFSCNFDVWKELS
jgi:hypothetical protein